MWPDLLNNIFPHYLIIGTIFEKKKLLNTKYVNFLHFYSTKYHRQQPFYNNLELLMMDIVVPETC